MNWVEQAPGSEGMPRILASHSLNPEALETHVRLYRTIMFGPSGLSRIEREAIAVAVSAVNDLPLLTGRARRRTGPGIRRCGASGGGRLRRRP